MYTKTLTIEGKILILKTFGLSQLIYNMQSNGFKKPDYINIERKFFKFIWSSNEDQIGIDRISRAIIKNEYEKGGMKVTDIESLDRSIKLRQFIRAQSLNHAISKLQIILNKDNRNLSAIKQEYQKVTNKESICESALSTIIFLSFLISSQNSCENGSWTLPVNYFRELV